MDVELVEIRDFLAEYPPFSTLDATLLNALPKMLSVRYLRRGSRFPPADETQPCLYLIRKGAVERRSGTGALLDTLCEGDLCAVDCLAADESSIGTAIEDALVYLLPCATLRALRREHATLDEYFVRSAAERLRLGRGALEPASQVRSSLLTLAVGAFVERQPVCGAPSLSIRQAAEIMTAERVSALLLVDAGKLCGIVTCAPAAWPPGSTPRRRSPAS